MLGNVGEEGEGDLRGVRHFYQHPSLAGRIAAHIVLDGAGADSAVSPGSRQPSLPGHHQGPGGHSFTDAGTPNPIAALAMALASFARTPLPEKPSTTLNIGTIQGGTSVNSIPESATASIDFRSTSSDELLRLEVALHRAVEDAVDQTNAAAKQLGLRNRGLAHVSQSKKSATAPPRNSPQTRPSSRPFAPSIAISALQTDLRLGSTDANIPIALGIPSLSMGAGGDGGGAHTLAEWYSDKDREIGLRRILLLTVAMTEWAAEQ